MVKRSVYFVLGIFLILVGIAGAFIPIFQGWIPFLIGVALLSKSSKTVHGYLMRLKARFPRQYQKLHEMRERLGKHRFK